jgi:hypothetical protein
VDREEASEHAEQMATVMGVVNMAWMMKVAKAMARDEVVFEDPEEMMRFRHLTDIAVMARLVKDQPAERRVWEAMGLPEMAENVRGMAGDGALVLSVRNTARATGRLLDEAPQTKLMDELFPGYMEPDDGLS